MEFISTATPEKTNEQGKAGDIESKRYFIDAGRFGQHRRSLPLVLRSRLCPSCQEGQVRDDELMDNIKRCCSQADGFVAAGQPFQESAFRLLLAKGGQPMSLGEMLAELKGRSGIGLLSLSARTLDRLLSRDTFYGIRPALTETAGARTPQLQN